MAVGWQRWRGPYPAIDTRTGPALRASAGPCWLTFSAYSRLRDHGDVVTHHVGGRVQPERHGGQGHGQGRWGDHPHVLLMSLLSLGAINGHWGHCVCSLAHWEYNTDSGTETEELWTESGSPGHGPVAVDQRPGRVSLHQSLRPPDGTACQERLLTTLRIIAILTFLILQLQLNVTRKWKIHQHNFKHYFNLSAAPDLGAVGWK